MADGPGCEPCDGVRHRRAPSTRSAFQALRGGGLPPIIVVLLRLVMLRHPEL